MILIKCRLLEKSSFNSVDKRQGMMQRRADHTLSARLGWPSSFSEHQQELVLEDGVWAPCRPNTKLFVHTGGTRRKAWASGESFSPHGPPFCLSSSISSHPPHSPTLATLFLHPWCSIFCWEAFFGNREGSGIVLRDQWKFRSGSTSRVVSFTVWSFRSEALLCLLCQAWWNPYDARFWNHLYKILSNESFLCLLMKLVETNTNWTMNHTSSESRFTGAKSAKVDSEVWHHLLNFRTQTK